MEGPCIKRLADKQGISISVLVYPRRVSDIFFHSNILREQTRPLSTVWHQSRLQTLAHDLHVMPISEVAYVSMSEMVARRLLGLTYLCTTLPFAPSRHSYNHVESDAAILRYTQGWCKRGCGAKVVLQWGTPGHSATTIRRAFTNGRALGN